MGRPSRVRATGPLAPHAAGFRRELALQGYTLNSASDQLRLMAHASRWLAVRGIGVEELSPACVEEFLADRRAEGYTLWLSSKAMVPMLDYLRGLGVLPTPAAAAPATEAERLQHHYRTFLVEERGLAAGTVAAYLHVAGLFLAARATDGVLHLDRLSAAEVTEFVLAECASRSVGSAKFVVCGLRSLLRYLYVAGHIDGQLDAAVPSVAGWRLAGVPVAFGGVEVARLLASCDRRTTFGRRDYAVLTLLARLGLRAGEVATLEPRRHRLARRRARGPRQRPTPRNDSRFPRCRRGRRRVVASGAAALRVRHGVHEGAGAAPAADQRRCVRHRAALPVVGRDCRS